MPDSCEMNNRSPANDSPVKSDRSRKYACFLSRMFKTKLFTRLCNATFHPTKRAQSSSLFDIFRNAESDSMPAHCSQGTKITKSVNTKQFV